MADVLRFIGNIPWWLWIIIFLILLAIYDRFINKKHTITQNFPVVGHLRYMFEKVGPELRQYIVASNRDELPFNRIERSWIYASAKNGNNYEGFGTDRDLRQADHIFIKNAVLPYQMKSEHPERDTPYFVACAKVIGEFHKRRRPYRPASIINVSAMSFGALSGPAVEAMNKGCKKAWAYQNTGEGGFASYHKHGADIIFEFGTGYFGVRTEDGGFSMYKLVKLVAENKEIRGIEIKLSQGAKPGIGGVLPKSKITPEIAKIRGVSMKYDVVSPPYHTAFSSMAELVDFVEDIAEKTGLPVGIKSAVGQMDQWEELAKIMKETGRGPDHITVDGGEGGTGAAPQSFTGYMSLPFIDAFTELYKVFLKEEITDQIVFIASGKLGFPAKAIMAFAMGADLINVAREAMLSVGCIQAKQCHLNTCPTGVATQSKWLQAGLNVKDKSERLNYYFVKFKKELLEMTYACGYEHPCQFKMEDVRINTSDKSLTRTLAQTFFYHKAEVPFESTETLYESDYLGAEYRKEATAKNKGKKTKTKEVETEETSATKPSKSPKSKERDTEKSPTKKVEREPDVKTGKESKSPSEKEEIAEQKRENQHKSEKAQEKKKSKVPAKDEEQKDIDGKQ